MEGARTRGQATAIAAVDGMLRGRVPHAILLVGPDGVGKTTLALDLAAALLCTAEPPAARPDRVCRACRLVEHGSHPDLHRLGPVGPGRQVVIGGSDPRARGVRDLLAELVLMPVEGGARVAIIEGADRMNEDAQSALLKTLEEPPAGVTIILCADQEARLLPTVRSRCARIRLGLVGARDIEAIVADHGLVDPPTASRLGRLAGGRPGIALAYARAPEAVLIRAELTRVLLDMTDARPSARLAAARAVVPRAMALVVALDPTATPAGPAKAPRRRGGATAATAATPAVAEPAAAPDPDADPAPDATPDEPVAGRAIPATERRRAVELLLSLWADVARDVVLVSEGGARSVRDTVPARRDGRHRGHDPAGRGRVVPHRDRDRCGTSRLERLARAHPRCPGAGLAAPRGSRLSGRVVERLEATVTGRVQGVGYRYFVLREADALDLVGWVANESDGSVRLVAEGPRDRLETLLASLREGPPGALVSHVSEAWMAAVGRFDGFGVRSAGHRGD